ncbi:hypothetical protein DFA_09706 [Cavenderia fasciculata]|uniref:ComC supersandwich domain-containing protein n=1 Tax=Cavenderia fasciculata TaxID=261658 RepID=F4Q8D4_CACFS|nr:uncharacterized protein DFA_09706 [Cavenderia fasciculata]EGG16034.1 hypothetical protein DFA_09706 [Cavenderia fasciculata]|eukprot:XP_004352359.1 hypothetical protein DFA_09706 [Cavenderia fasciculata]
MSYFDVRGNQLTGTIPDIVFSQLNGIKSISVLLSNNPGLTGTLPNDLCQVKQLSILNTSITGIPDCFWCYNVSGSTILITSLSMPSHFACNVTINNRRLPALFTQVMIEGSNLGWAIGKEPQLIPIIPNSLLRYTYQKIGPPELVNIEIASGSYNFEFELVEAGITLSSIAQNQSTTDGTIMLMITFTQYNQYISHFVFLKQGLNTYPCIVQLKEGSKLYCKIYQLPLVATYQLTVHNEFFSARSPIIMSKSIVAMYPLVSSADYQSSPSPLLTFNGFFGENLKTVNTSVILNSTTTCITMSITSGTITCAPTSIMTPGQVFISITVDGNQTPFSLLSIPYQDNLKANCIEQTFNCHGHGQCNDQGICQCNQGYYDDFATFELDGYQFFFSLVAIQELDADDNIVQELITDKWNVTDLSGDDLTSLHYRLLINSTLYPTLSTVANITSLIEYSTLDRQLPFGDSIVSVGANSIKVGVNVTGWQYQSILSHLRVVFATIVNNEQSRTQSCSSNDIPTFEEILGSDSYLRVIKNNTQFYGRFLSYSYSDGRKTFSRNELINQTIITGKSNESLALIGVHIPQCASCLLDPDFSALITDNSKNDEDCETSSSSENTWKIIVGACVGGTVFIALVIALVFSLKNSNRFKIKVKAAKSIMLKKMGTNK